MTVNILHTYLSACSKNNLKMPRKPRELKADYCYHITTRCNNREFKLMGGTLEECAAKYRGFCRKYKPQPKPEKRNHWGSKLLGGMNLKHERKRKKNSSPGQLSLPWDKWKYQVSENPEVQEITKRFVRANSQPIPNLS